MNKTPEESHEKAFLTSPAAGYAAALTLGVVCAAEGVAIEVAAPGAIGLLIGINAVQGWRSNRSNHRANGEIE